MISHACMRVMPCEIICCLGGSFGLFDGQVSLFCADPEELQRKRHLLLTTMGAPASVSDSQSDCRTDLHSESQSDAQSSDSEGEEQTGVGKTDGESRLEPSEQRSTQAKGQSKLRGQMEGKQQSTKRKEPKPPKKPKNRCLKIVVVTSPQIRALISRMPDKHKPAAVLRASRLMNFAISQCVILQVESIPYFASRSCRS